MWGGWVGKRVKGLTPQQIHRKQWFDTSMLTSYPQAVLLLAWASFAFSVVACVLAWKKTDIGPLRKAQANLKLQLDMLEAESSQLTAAWKRTNARIAMAQAREKASGNTTDDGLPDPQSDPEGWRAAVRQRYLVRK